MAAAAEAVADHVVLTSDNPRSLKSPELLLWQDMLKGLKAPFGSVSPADLIVPRPSPMWWLLLANSRDVILIAGKGHEETQEIAGVKHPFDDRLHAQRSIACCVPTKAF